MADAWENLELDGLLGRIWSGLEQAVRRPGHPWRTPVLATAGDGADARVVVLREVDLTEWGLVLHTDSRSPKVTALGVDPRVTWVFYDPEAQVQVRIRARARLHVGDPVAARAWSGVPEGSRMNYRTTSAPGSRLEGPLAGHDFRDALQFHFAVVWTHVETVDWLWLREGGHRRAGWRREAGGWLGEWRMP